MKESMKNIGIIRLGLMDTPMTKKLLDASKIAEAFGGGFADSKPLQLMAPRMASDNFQPIQWHVATLIKDLQQAQHLAEELGQELAASKEALRCILLRGDDCVETELSTLVKVFEGYIK